MKKLLSIFIMLLALSAGSYASAGWETESEHTAALHASSASIMARAETAQDALTRSALASMLSGSLSGEDKEVSRCELAQILYDYMESEGLCAAVRSQVPAITDVYPPETRYLAAIRKMISYGILSAAEDGSFRPLETVSAAQAAVILARFQQLTEPLERRGDTPANTLAAGSVQDRAWLGDACILGHSHAVGMRMTLGLDEMDYYAKDGVMATYFLDYTGFEQSDGGVGSVRWGLQINEYKKVYLLLGTNDMPGGYANTAAYEKSMREIIELVQEFQPEAEIYILSVAPVGLDYCNYTPNVSKDYVTAYNRVLKTLSRDYQLVYIDLFTPLSNLEGYMNMELGSYDALHFNADGYNVFLQEMLRRHS